MDIPISDRLADGHALTPQPDGLLLEQFVQHGNHDAFAALMERHGPYVLSVCRHLTRHAEDAEDVFQACFLELVRKATSIRQSNSVAGWLQTVAVRLARKMQAGAMRQRHKEQAVAQREGSVGPEDISWREACQILQEEIARLPEDLRLPIILCLFQGHTQEEAAHHLGVNPRTVKDRLRRGRELLRDRLVRRGVTLAVLGTLLSATNLQAAVPAALVQGTLQSAAVLTKTAALAAVPIGVTGSGLAAWASAVAAVLGLAVAGSGAYIVWDQVAEPVAAPVVAPVPKPAPVAVGPALRKIQHSFRNKQFDTKFFQWSGPNAETYAQFEDEGLRITLPAANGPAESIGIKLRPKVRGDVQVEATLEVLNVPPPKDGYGAGVTVYFFMPSADRDGVWLGKFNDPLRGPGHAFGHRIGPPIERLNKLTQFLPVEPAAGFTRLKVVRKGARFDLYAAEGLAGEFKALHSMKVSAADMTIVRFAADPIWRPDVPIDARLIDFTISAEEFVGYE